MPTRRVRGVLVTEGVQTGDGRVIADGSITWADLPLPFAWLRDGDQHISLTEVAPQVGIIETITRQDGGNLAWTGVLDTDIPEAAEMVRRLQAGTAPLGNRWGVSIDPDDWQVEIIATNVDEEEGGGILLLASGTGMPQFRRQLQAAAGEPDPGSEGGVLLFEDASDSILERYTRMRIRGATACAVAAFTEAWMELEPEGAETAEPEEAPAEPEPEARAMAASGAPLSPPAAWLAMPEPEPDMRGMVDVYGMPVEELLVEQPDGALAVPLTITDDGRVFGHAARFGQCHISYPGQCVTAPESPTDYAYFHTGEVVCDDGSRVATGTLTVGCDHAPEGMRATDARDHYANSGLGWADVRASNGVYGVWTCGVLRPDVDEAQLRVLRALTLSGDWRRIGAGLEFIAALAVNVAGFPIAREAVTAGGMAHVAAAGATRLHLDDGVQTALVAGGVVHRCAECQRRASMAAGGVEYSEALLTVEPDPRIDQLLSLVQTVERRTRQLVPAAAEHMAQRIRR